MSASQSDLPAVPESKSVQELAQSLPGRVFRPGALTVVVSLALGAAGAFGGLAFAQSGVKGTVDAGVKPLEVRLEVVERRQLAQQEDIHEVQVDIRALYKAVMSGERQPRLEQPPTQDGGR